MQLVHLGTRIVSNFGVVDDNGNTIQSIPVQGDLPVFDEASFASAFQQIEAKRQELVAQIPKSPASQEFSLYEGTSEPVKTAKRRKVK
jgi:hypothetical protein